MPSNRDPSFADTASAGGRRAAPYRRRRCPDRPLSSSTSQEPGQRRPHLYGPLRAAGPGRAGPAPPRPARAHLTLPGGARPGVGGGGDSYRVHLRMQRRRGARGEGSRQDSDAPYATPSGSPPPPPRSLLPSPAVRLPIGGRLGASPAFPVMSAGRARRHRRAAGAWGPPAS